MHTATILPGRILFELKDTHGLPLDISIDHALSSGLEIEWQSFIDAARNAGWWDFKTHKTLEYAFADTTWINHHNPDYQTQVMERFKLYVISHPHPNL